MGSVLLTRSRPPSDLSRGRRGLWVVLLLTGSVFLLTAAYSSVSGDVWTANVASWQLATTGDPWLESVDLPVLDQHPARDVWVVTVPSGHEVIGRSPGAVIAAIPAYVLLGSSTFSLIPGAITAALLTAISASLVYGTLRLQMKDREAALAALLFALSTPVWSVAANGSLAAHHHRARCLRNGLGCVPRAMVAAGTVRGRGTVGPVAPCAARRSRGTHRRMATSRSSSDCAGGAAKRCAPGTAMRLDPVDV